LVLELLPRLLLLPELKDCLWPTLGLTSTDLLTV
jgi:hypothetical protein